MNEPNNNKEKKKVQTPAPTSKTVKTVLSKDLPSMISKWFSKLKDMWLTWAIWKKIGSFKRLNKEKKFYLYTATSCALVLIATVIVAVSVSNNDVKSQAGLNSVESSTPIVDSVGGKEDTSTDETPVVNTPDGMILPVETAALGSDYGFFYNQTIDAYYVHAGVDFMAQVGAQVFAVEDGMVESIYKDDLLSGTEIVINHGNGLKTLYRFVAEAGNIKVGQKVKKGDVIATVAEANGDEYKDGAHLHFEVLKNNKSVDPTSYLTLDEK